TGDVRRGHVIPDLAAALRAVPVEVQIGVHPDLLLRRIARERERREVRRPLLVGAEAAERGAAADPARVEADEIEPRPYLGRGEEWTGEGRVVDAGASRPAWIQEQRTDSVRLVGRGQPHDRQRDCRPVRLVIVERNLNRAALERAQLRVALAPGDL